MARLDRGSSTRPYLISVIHPDNSPSILLAERLGFTFDRRDVTPWNDVLVYRREVA